jgi:hypothetical protein
MRNLLFCLLCLMSLAVCSQTVTYDTIVEIKELDKGVFDTILYVKKHVQIKKEVVVVDTVEGYKWAFDTYGGTATEGFKVHYTAPNLTLITRKPRGAYFGGSLYYSFSKEWSARVGAKLDYQKIVAGYTKATNFTVEVSEEVRDTLDSYYNLIGVDTNYFYITESNTILSSEERIRYTDLTYEWQLYYLKIPIQVSYAMAMDKWNFSLLAGASLNFQLEKLSKHPSSEAELLVSFFPTAILSGQAGYTIRESTIISLEPVLEGLFSEMFADKLGSYRISIGLGVKQFF